MKFHNELLTKNSVNKTRLISDCGLYSMSQFTWTTDGQKIKKPSQVKPYWMGYFQGKRISLFSDGNTQAECEIELLKHQQEQLNRGSSSTLVEHRTDKPG